MELPTLIAPTTVSGMPRAIDLPPAPPVKPARKQSLRAAQKITRAHVGLWRNPAHAELLSSSEEAVAARLTEELGQPLSIEARVDGSAIDPVTSTSDAAIFVAIEFADGIVGALEIDLMVTAAILDLVAGSPQPRHQLCHLSSIEQAALGWLVLCSLSACRSIELIEKHYRPRLIAICPSRDELFSRTAIARPCVSVNLAIDIGATRGTARLLVPAALVEKVVNASAVKCDAVLPDFLKRVSVPISNRFGRAILLFSEAANLGRGDVILVSAKLSDRSIVGTGRIVTPNFEIDGEFSNEGFRVTAIQAPPEKAEPMSQNDQHLPVEVELELTRISATAHELAQITVGGILPLHLTVAHHVTVRIANKPVARAELVDIEGELGARIIEMLME